MRVLLIGPLHGRAMAPYLDLLAGELREAGAVHRLGSRGLPYDEVGQGFWRPQRIVEAADALLEAADLSSYDLLSMHFGKLEIEQLLPARWGGPRRPPAVYHVHSLDWSLFSRHVPEPQLHAAVTRGVHDMDGFIYFGSYAKSKLGPRVRSDVPCRVSLWPVTLLDSPDPGSSAALRRALDYVDRKPSLGTLHGFASPWKDMRLLLSAFQLMTKPLAFVLAGAYWDQPSQAGVDLRSAVGTPMSVGPVEVVVVPDYMESADRAALVAASDLAIFPYRADPSFQGSGPVADYLARGVPVVATDVASMREIIGNAGLIVPQDDPVELARALDQVVGDEAQRTSLATAARLRGPLFTLSRHARACLELYESVAQAGGVDGAKQRR
jgi:glycosyltransferase involved in cell wall biosynthesis